MTQVLKVSLVAVMCLGAAAQADVMSFQAGVSPDAAYGVGGATIRNNAGSDGSNYGDSDQLIVGGVNGDFQLRGLLSFDLSAIEAAAGGSPIQVDSVSLVMNAVDGGQYGSSAGDLKPFVLATYLPFDEMNCSWNDPQGSAGDDVAGGTPGAELGSATFDPINAGVHTFGDTVAFRAAATAALAATDNTLNLMLYNPEAELLDAGSYGDSAYSLFARFASDDAADASTGPQLLVSYSVVPEPATLGLAVIGGLGVLLRRRRKVA